MRSDYIGHFIAGWAFTLSSCFLIPVIPALFVGIVAGTLKELLHDEIMECGEPELADTLWTFAGATGAAIFYLIFGGGV